MKIIAIALMLISLVLLAGCGTMNAGYSSLLNSTAQDYTGAKANIQQTDDMKLRGWVDAACAVNIGALQRAISTSGNPNIANAVFTACPVPGVGVTTTTQTGSMQVQTFMPSVVHDAALQPVSQAVVQPTVVVQSAPTPPQAIAKPARTRRKPVAKPTSTQSVTPAPVTMPAPVATAPAPIATPVPVPSSVSGLKLPSALP